MTSCPGVNVALSTRIPADQGAKGRTMRADLRRARPHPRAGAPYERQEGSPRMRVAVRLSITKRLAPPPPRVTPDQEQQQSADEVARCPDHA